MWPCQLIGSRYDNINTAIPECGLAKSILELISKSRSWLHDRCHKKPLDKQACGQGVRKSFK